MLVVGRVTHTLDLGLCRVRVNTLDLANQGDMS